MPKKIKRPDKVTLNIQLPKELHDRFKTYAIEQGEPMRYFVQQDIKKRVGEPVRTAIILNPETSERREITLNQIEKPSCDHKGYVQYSVGHQDFCGNCSQPLSRLLEE